VLCLPSSPRLYLHGPESFCLHSSCSYCYRYCPEYPAAVAVIRTQLYSCGLTVGWEVSLPQLQWAPGLPWPYHSSVTLGNMGSPRFRCSFINRLVVDVKTEGGGWGFGSVVKYLPSKHKALGSVPSSKKKKKKKKTKTKKNRGRSECKNPGGSAMMETQLKTHPAPSSWKTTLCALDAVYCEIHTCEDVE